MQFDVRPRFGNQLPGEPVNKRREPKIMKRLLASTAVAALLAAVNPAYPADLTNPSNSAKDPYAAAAVWQGFYMEAGIGPGFTQNDTKVFTTSGTLSSTGAEFDGRVGYDRSIGNNLLLGVYADFGNSFDVNGKFGSGPNVVTWGEKWTYSLGAKAGYDYDSGQAYCIAGYAHQDISVAALTSWGTGLDGIKYGCGIQMKIFGPHLYTGLEFTQTRFNAATAPASFALSNLTFTDTNDEVKAKIGWKF